MPQTRFELINHAYSFSYSVTHSGGETFSLPQSDYGVYGHHVDAFFNSLSATGNGTSHLVAWFLSDKGLTWSLGTSGGTTQILNYIDQKFPIGATSQGRGLIDLRGSPDWKLVIGDGIVAPTLLAASGSTNNYTEGVKKVYQTIKTAYPNIDWAIAGLPHLPYFMTFSPDIGLSANMQTTKHNPPFNFGQWDTNHPTGPYDKLYGWSEAPARLKTYYTDLAKTGMQNTILDECDPDWFCPDVRVPYQKNFPFYKSGYIHDENYERNKRTCEIAVQFGTGVPKKVIAEISTTYPSRYWSEYDDPIRATADFPYYDFGILGTGQFDSVTGPSGEYSPFYPPRTSSDAYYPIQVFQYDMLQSAADAGCHGFLLSDPVPGMIEISCTASTAGLFDASSTGFFLQAAEGRPKNMFSSILFGGLNDDGYSPDGGWTAGWVKNELRRLASNQVKGMLDRIRETVSIGLPEDSRQFGLIGKNGWERTIEFSTGTEITLPTQTSTNVTASDETYGQQNWSYLGGPNPWECSCECDPTDPECCPDETNPDCDCASNPFAFGCCDPDGNFDPEICCGDGPGQTPPTDPACQDPCEGLPCEKCSYVINPGGFSEIIECWISACDAESSGCPEAGENGGPPEGFGCLNEAGCNGGGQLVSMVVKGSDYAELLKDTNEDRVSSGVFIRSRKYGETPVADWSKTVSKNRTDPHTGRVFITDPNYSLPAIRAFTDKDLGRHQVFGNFSP